MKLNIILRYKNNNESGNKELQKSTEENFRRNITSFSPTVYFQKVQDKHDSRLSSKFQMDTIPEVPFDLSHESYSMKNKLGSETSLINGEQGNDKDNKINKKVIERNFRRLSLPNNKQVTLLEACRKNNVVYVRK